METVNLKPSEFYDPLGQARLVSARGAVPMPSPPQAGEPVAEPAVPAVPGRDHGGDQGQLSPRPLDPAAISASVDSRFDLFVKAGLCLLF